MLAFFFFLHVGRDGGVKKRSKSLCVKKYTDDQQHHGDGTACPFMRKGSLDCVVYHGKFPVILRIKQPHTVKTIDWSTFVPSVGVKSVSMYTALVN